MSHEHRSTITPPGFAARVSRRAIDWMTEPLNPTITSMYSESIDRANEYTQTGWGNVFFFTHPTKWDQFAIMKRIIMKSDEMKDVPILIPTAHHQAKRKQKALAWLLDVKSPYIVTEHSVERYGYDASRLGEGTSGYLNMAADVIQVGGIVGVSVQGGRMPYLGPVTPAASMLLRHLYRKVDHPFGVMCIGVGVQGLTSPEDFSMLNGYNFSRTYILNCSKHQDSEDIRSQFQDVRGRLSREYDAHVFTTLGELSHSTYRGD